MGVLDTEIPEAGFLGEVGMRARYSVDDFSAHQTSDEENTPVLLTEQETEQLKFISSFSSVVIGI